jgi:TolB protein
MLDAGECFNDVFDGDQFDFTVAPDVVDCSEPHDNEVMGIVELGEGSDPYPGPEALQDLAIEECSGVALVFLGGQDIVDLELYDFYVWPDEEDWGDGVRTAVCAVYGTDQMIGTASSGFATAGSATLAVVAEVDGVVDVWAVDGQTGELLINLTDDDAQEVLNPVAWSPDGTRIAYGTTVDDDIWILDVAAGTGPEPLVSGPGAATAPDFSPDGSSLLYVSDEAGNGELDIFVLDLATGAVTQLTENPDRDSSPEYSPDGSKIVFRGRYDGNSDIYVMNADGSGLTRLTEDPAFEGDPTWTPDGEHIVFISDRTGDYDIYVMRADGSDVVNLTNHPAADEYPDVIPGGGRIAFHSDRHGGTRVWVMAMDGSNQSLLTTYGPTGYVSFAPVQ